MRNKTACDNMQCRCLLEYHCWATILLEQVQEVLLPGCRKYTHLWEQWCEVSISQRLRFAGNFEIAVGGPLLADAQGNLDITAASRQLPGVCDITYCEICNTYMKTTQEHVCTKKVMVNKQQQQSKGTTSRDTCAVGLLFAVCFKRTTKRI